MNIYHQKQQWKVYLLIAALGIVVCSFLYTNNLTKKLAKEERKKVELWAKGMRELTRTHDIESDYNYSFILEVIEKNETVPMILTDENEQVIYTWNVHLQGKNQEQELKKLIREMKSERKPIVIDLPREKQYIFYKDSNLLTHLTYFPLIQLGVVALFLLISYYAFSTSRKAEQNQVWVGMSKETAHQLGTPTSSLLANLELLKNESLKNPEIMQEIEKDVNRLNKIAERFSKIGSKPSLQYENILDVIRNVMNYIKSRVSEKVEFIVNLKEDHPAINIPLNKSLFEWVIENLLKNAIDSMDGIGKVELSVFEKSTMVYIDVRDEGKGIPKSKHKTIFQPGYTTKRRGWGLGLSLAKRIVEQYHKGKIFVEHSEPDKGTTIRIILKK